MNTPRIIRTGADHTSRRTRQADYMRQHVHVPLVTEDYSPRRDFVGATLAVVGLLLVTVLIAAALPAASPSTPDGASHALAFEADGGQP